MRDFIYDDSEMLYYDDNIIDSAITTYDELNVGFDSMSQDINKSGEINKQVDLFGNGITKISKQSSAISQRYRNVKKILSDSRDKWMLFESKLKSEISSVSIPVIEELNSTNLSASYNNVSLNKNDGKAINSGVMNFSTTDFDSSISEKQKIDNINNNIQTTSVEMEDNISIEQTNMANINKSTDVGQAQLDSGNLEGNKITLENINNAQIVDNKELDFNSSIINKINLYNNAKENVPNENNNEVNINYENSNKIDLESMN
jgi:hypothetical protein